MATVGSDAGRSVWGMPLVCQVGGEKQTSSCDGCGGRMYVDALDRKTAVLARGGDWRLVETADTFTDRSVGWRHLRKKADKTAVIVQDCMQKRRAKKEKLQNVNLKDFLQIKDLGMTTLTGYKIWEAANTRLT